MGRHVEGRLQHRGRPGAGGGWQVAGVNLRTNVNPALGVRTVRDPGLSMKCRAREVDAGEEAVRVDEDDAGRDQGPEV